MDDQLRGHTRKFSTRNQYSLSMNEEKFSNSVQQIFMILTLFCRNKNYEFIVAPSSDPYGKKPREVNEPKYRLKGIINAPTSENTSVFDLSSETQSMFLVELCSYLLRTVKDKVDQQFHNQVMNVIKQVFNK